MYREREEDADLARRKKKEVTNKIQIKWVNKKEDLNFVITLADQIISGRKGIYEDNWALMSLDSLLSGALYKVDRARTTQKILKQLDDVLDAINYLRFSAVRIIKEIHDRKLRLIR